jgi:hypothetical protein
MRPAGGSRLRLPGPGFVRMCPALPGCSGHGVLAPENPADPTAVRARRLPGRTSHPGPTPLNRLFSFLPSGVTQRSWGPPTESPAAPSSPVGGTPFSERPQDTENVDSHTPEKVPGTNGTAVSLASCGHTNSPGAGTESSPLPSGTKVLLRIAGAVSCFRPSLADIATGPPWIVETEGNRRGSQKAQRQ